MNGSKTVRPPSRLNTAIALIEIAEDAATRALDVITTRDAPPPRSDIVHVRALLRAATYVLIDHARHEEGEP